MREKDVYKHFRGTLYQYVGVALGIQSQFKSVRQHHDMKLIGTARHHETLQDLNVYECYGIRFIDSLDAHVLYHNPEQNTTWARAVDEFFGYKEHNGQRVKRFMLLPNNKQVELMK